jgi:peroxiredoxin
MTSPPQVGQSAPNLSLPTLDGHRVDLAAMRGQLILLSFLRHAG